MDLFSVFNEHDNTSHREGIEVTPAMPLSMYAVPNRCEYCGCESTDQCSNDCQRPRSLFRKKRPPFCPPSAGRWDPMTDEAIVIDIQQQQQQKKTLELETSHDTAAGGGKMAMYTTTPNTANETPSTNSPFLEGLSGFFRSSSRSEQ